MEKEVMPGWYEIKKDSNGNHRFLLKSTASGTLLESGTYHDLKKVELAVQSFSAGCAAPERFRLHMAPCGKNFFSVHDKSGAELLRSKLYDSEISRETAIGLIAQAGINGTVRT
ncbi:YegP family protein [Pseudomonas mosselii]|uniref:YegP family protein n=1 Tax=Pseudomonas mosselii TaxID=78327 RepID=UPI003F3FCE52